MLSTLRNENRSPGGTDNAGSVAILFELARELPASIPADVELILLSPSAEEDHMVGVMRWLSRNLATERAGGAAIVAINLDGAGSPGRAVAMQWFGFGQRFGPTIIRAAREASTALSIPMRRLWLPPAVGVDGIPFVHRGIECVTFSSGSLGRETMAVHSAKDVANNLCEGSLENVYRLVHETARRLTE
jgi:Zn-dependent M28 family amino/carboxypeptidase